MSFKVRKIQVSEKQIKNRFWRWMVQIFGPKLSVLIVAILGISFFFIAGSLLFGKMIIEEGLRQIPNFVDLEVDEFGHTNILLLGVAGEGREGGHLSDSIMIVSINPKGPSVSFLGLPRDLYVASEIGNMKVNGVYAKARWQDLLPKLEETKEAINTIDKKIIANSERNALKVAQASISDFTGVEIHYGLVIDFKIFQEVIDVLGGIDIFVPETIEDPFYPDVNYGFQTFVIRKGVQHLNGEMALKYSRSRKTTSDYSRAQRQHDVVLAIRKKASDLNMLTDLDKLKGFYDIFKERVTTNLNLTEIIALAQIGASINYENSISAVLNDDPSQKGGFLYPPAQDLYGGQFVLLPENIEDIQVFMSLVLLHPSVLLEKAQISILNGSGISGKASSVASRLRRFGFHVIDTGNYENSNIIVKPFIEDVSGKSEQTIDFIQKLLRVPDVKVNGVFDENSLIDFRLVLGTN